ncbi:MAG: 1,4-beta-xylanase, partial [Bacteroidota bacterium]
MRLSIISILLLLLAACSEPVTQEVPDPVVWSNEVAWEWYEKQDWFVGANFTPSTAINQIEFWQEESFDVATIDRELGYAEGIGMNIMRVYMHYLVWARNPKGLKKRMHVFLDLAAKHK